MLSSLFLSAFIVSTYAQDSIYYYYGSEKIYLKSNVLNHDFNKIYKMNRINLANPENLVKIMVRDESENKNMKKNYTFAKLNNKNF